MNKAGWWTAVWLGLAVGWSLPATAQEAKPGAQRAIATHHNLDKMAENFGLSPDQKANVKAVLETEAKQQQGVRTDPTLTLNQRRENAEALTQESTAKLKEILTAEQFDKWQKARESVGQRVKARHQQTGTGRLLALSDGLNPSDLTARICATPRGQGF